MNRSSVMASFSDSDDLSITIISNMSLLEFFVPHSLVSKTPTVVVLGGVHMRLMYVVVVDVVLRQLCGCFGCHLSFS